MIANELLSTKIMVSRCLRCVSLINMPTGFPNSDVTSCVSSFWGDVQPSSHSRRIHVNYQFVIRG